MVQVECCFKLKQYDSKVGEAFMHQTSECKLNKNIRLYMKAIIFNSVAEKSNKRQGKLVPFRSLFVKK